MVRHCFALDLIDDPAMMDEYEAYHKKVWPEVLASLKEAGIERLEIYKTGSRLFMILEANDTFSLEEKSVSDAKNTKVQEWEKLMWKYQKALPNAGPGEKWMLTERIFKL